MTLSIAIIASSIFSMSLFVCQFVFSRWLIFYIGIECKGSVWGVILVFSFRFERVIPGITRFTYVAHLFQSSNWKTFIHLKSGGRHLFNIPILEVSLNAPSISSRSFMRFCGLAINILMSSFILYFNSLICCSISNFLLPALLVNDAFRISQTL